MSNRNMSAAMLTETAKKVTTSCILVELGFDSGTVYYNTSNRNVTWDGSTYIPGHITRIPAVVESMGFSINSIQIEITGVPTANISTALSEEVFGRSVILRRAFFDSSYDIIVDPIILFDGEFTSEPNIVDDRDGGISTITWEAANAFADYERIAGRRGNDEDQQLYFPGDKGMEFASEIVKDLPWGRPSAQDSE